MSEARPQPPTTATSGPQLLLVLYRTLSSEEQEEAFDLLTDARVEQLAGEENQTARLLQSLQLVAAGVGGEPTVDEYRETVRALRGEGVEIEPLSRVIKHFGSWRRAKEALALSETETARQIEARFHSRRLDKIWRYTEQSLGETLRRCVENLGHVPQVAEFEWWRQRELELARALGNDALHLPSNGPYRRRYGSWEKALLHFGFTPDQVAERLERQ